MSLNSSQDPMVEEVRQIRAAIVAKFGNDIDKLANHLLQVGRDYAERRGIFATVTRKAAAKVQASWGNMSAPPHDVILDEVRAIRTSKAAKAAGGKKSRKKPWRC